MQEVHARLSGAGRVVCGRPDEDGRFTCDQPLADLVTGRRRSGLPARRLAPLPGWTQDSKGVWQKTTQVEDRRARGLAPPRTPPERRAYPALPALVRCPKCRTVQWLDARRLRVPPHAGTGGSRPSPGPPFAPVRRHEHRPPW